MARKISQVLFFVFGLLTIFFIVSTVLASRRVDYLTDNKDLLNNSDYDYISMTLIFFNNDDTKTYVVKEPLYKETFEKRDNNNSLQEKITISIYSVIEHRNNNFDDLFAIVIDDLLVRDPFYLEDIDDLPILEISMTLNETPLNFETRHLKDPLFVIPGSNKRVAFFKFDSFKTASDYAKIEKLIFSYKLKNDMPDKTLVTLSNKDLYDEIYQDNFEDTYNRNINNLTKEKIIYGDKDNLNNNELIFHNSIYSKLFRQTTKMFILPLVLDFIFLIAAYYLLFYHKYVIIKLKQKRNQKKERILLLEKEFEDKKKGEN